MIELSYSLSRAQLEAIRTKLKASNILLEKDSGDVSYKGVQLTFDYVEPKLSVTIVDGGGYPTFILKSKLNSWFKEQA